MMRLAALAPWVRGLVVLAALGSLAVAAAPVAWHLGGWSAALPERPPAPEAAPAPLPPVDVGPILALAPFGAPAEAEAPAPEAPVGETTLDLTLLGVVVQPDPQASTAFIQGPDGAAPYHPGEAIGASGTLIEVAADRVTIEVDGERQTLSFPGPGPGLAPGSDLDAEGESQAQAQADDPLLSGAERLRALVAAQGETHPMRPVLPDHSDPQTPQDYIDLWRERIRADPAEVLDTIGLIATPEGYRIAERHDSGVDLAGLQAGDLVTSVNGQAVGDVDRDRALYDEVAASGLARVEVRRGDRVIVMTFPLR